MNQKKWTRGLGACVLAAVVIGWSPATVLAQAPTTQNAPAGAHRTPGEALAWFKAALAKLDLTADQQTKINAIIADAKTQLQALRSQAGTGTGDHAALREKARAIVRDAHQKIAAVLTPEQKAKLREMWKQDHPGAASAAHAGT
jgi:Spy/CpxP family protein refolding chaperone